MNDTKSFLAEIKASRTDARFQIRWKKKAVPSAIEPTKGGVSGILTSDGIQLTFDYDQEYSFKITAYNMLGQQLTESFVGNYSKNVITFSDDVYGAHSLVDIINMTTGERTTIRLGK
jgi:Tfp pilus assembly protein FimT